MSPYQRAMVTCLFPVVAALATGGPAPSLAQDSSISPYADPAGTISVGNYDGHPYGGGGYVFSVYVVLFAEDVVSGVAYRFHCDGLGSEVFVANRYVGPSGEGLFLNEDPPYIGTNVALRECVSGIGGAPVLVEEYELVAVDSYSGGIATVEANVNQLEGAPVYVNCRFEKHPCAPGPPLVFRSVLPTQARSIARIKSLFH